MLRQEVRYELCTEDAKGFNPHPRVRVYKTFAEAQKVLEGWRYSYPNENTFIVRTTMVRMSKKKKSQSILKAV